MRGTFYEYQIAVGVLLTSMFTSITGTRAIIELLYGKRQIKKLSVGI
jgi:preprotein translocase subunit SecD